MGRIELTRELYDKLKLLDKYASKVTVRHDSLTTHNIKITLNPFSDTEFTVSVKELLSMCSVTNEFQMNRNIHYAYTVDIGGTSLTFKRRIKVYEELFTITYASPRFSIVVPSFVLLSTDDHSIEVDKTGRFEIRSDGYVKTGTTFSNLTIAHAEIDSFKCRVKHKALQPIEEFQNDLIFSFFDDHLMVHVLEEPNITNILLVPVLID